jgi:hypothetical protein
MEPITGPVPTHDVSFTLALLADLGWSLTCGNSVVDTGEACDDGPKNSDTLPDRCRSDCQRSRCGDGVKDSDEACDGKLDDQRANACRSGCALPTCGDGVIDNAEECDQGASNSDTRAGACRTSCKKPTCGDGVVDSRGEECDDGTRNSDTRAGACRTRCRKPFCGDGVVDPGETCDGSTGCSDQCTRDSAIMESRDVVDAGRDAPDAEAGVDASAEGTPRRSDCSCRIVRGERLPSSPLAASWTLGLAVAVWRTRRCRRK